MQVYLPDDLHRAVKGLGLPASELLQRAIRAELRRRELDRNTDEYLAELIAEVGEPTAEDVVRAESKIERILSRRSEMAG